MINHGNCSITITYTCFPVFCSEPAAKGGRGKRGAKRKTEDTAASSSKKEEETDESKGRLSKLHT